MLSDGRAGAPSKSSRRDIIPEPGDNSDICFHISLSLLDYEALGGNAAERMPEVAEHLRHCHRCAQELAEYRKDTAPRRAWEELAKGFRERVLPLLLWLIGGKWYWGNEIGERRVTLKQVDSDAHLSVGNWFLRPGLAAARAWGPTGQPIQLSTSLPGQEGEIFVTITPSWQPADNRDVWRVSFGLSPSSQLPFVDVGIGTASGCTTGTAELRSQRPVEFELVPPTLAAYWAYFEWSAGGRNHHHRLELPIRSKTEEIRS